MMPKQPAMTGAITHAANTCDTPFHPQLTPSAPIAAIPTSMTPPTVPCLEQCQSWPGDKGRRRTNVVETGNPTFVPTVSQVDEPIKAHIMPSMSIAGCCLNAETLRILLLIVSATREPTRTAPPNSMTVAMSIACFMVRDREETEVAKELATSFAPMFHASRNAKSMPMAKM
jgi:hypothetical protein